MYNASNNELVRTKPLVKGAILQVDAAPFKNWYKTQFGIELGKKKNKGGEEEEVKKSGKVLRKLAKRAKQQVLDKELLPYFMSGRLLARVSSRPGQVGRCDGYLLEGPE